MFEHHAHPLLSFEAFLKRVIKNFALSTIIILISLGIGVVGYHAFAGFGWLDALLNASMILTGMGPVNEVASRSGKIFATCYALFSGVVFLTTIVIVLAPVVHRFLHKFHLEKNAK